MSNKTGGRFLPCHGFAAFLETALLGALLAVGVASPASADSELAQISGTVTAAETGEPLGFDVEVSVWDASNEAPDEESSTRVEATPGVNTGSIDATLAVAPGVSGMVTDKNGDPIGGITVQAFDGETFAGAGFTGAAGTYEILGMVDGDYSVYFVDFAFNAAFVAEWYDDAPDQASATPIEVAAGETVDGSDVGLNTANEDIEAIAVLGDGRLVVSTKGRANANGAKFTGQDIVVLDDAVYGPDSSGTWNVYLDGSDEKLQTSSERITGASIGQDGAVSLATLGRFNVAGAKGTSNDVFSCHGIIDPDGEFGDCLFGVTFRDLVNRPIDGLHVGSPATLAG